jgi:hypothetical protein
MLNWWQLAFETSQMAFEAQEVVAMRLTKIGRGDAAASVEAQQMVVEKTLVIGEAWMAAAGAAMANGSPQSVAAAFMRPYRKRVRANRRRLSR